MPTEVASGRTGVWAKAGIPVRARNSVHCPKRASTKPQQNAAMGGKPAGVRPRREFQSSVDHLHSTQSENFRVSPRSDRASRLENFIYAGAARHCSRNLDRW
jgi:hypothetical protein